VPGRAALTYSNRDAISPPRHPRARSLAAVRSWNRELRWKQARNSRSARP